MTEILLGLFVAISKHLVSLAASCNTLLFLVSVKFECCRTLGVQKIIAATAGVDYAPPFKFPVIICHELDRCDQLWIIEPCPMNCNSMS